MEACCNASGPAEPLGTPELKTSRQTTGLLSLPVEIMELIATAIGAPWKNLHILVAGGIPRWEDHHIQQRALFSLMMSCRAMHNIIKPFLYKYNRDHGDSSAVGRACYGELMGTLELAVKYGLDLDECMCPRVEKDTLSRLGLLRYETLQDIRSKYPDVAERAGPGESMSPLMYSVLERRIQSVRWLLNHGAYVEDWCNVTCWPILAFAIEDRSAAIALLLIRGGAEPRYYPADLEEGHYSLQDIARCSRIRDCFPTALHHAAFHGFDAVVEALVQERKVDVNAPTKHGLTPLMAALSGYSDEDQDRDHERTLRLLIGLGSDLERKADFCGILDITPLQQAVAFRHYTAARILVEAGADAAGKTQLALGGLPPPPPSSSSSSAANPADERQQQQQRRAQQLRALFAAAAARGVELEPGKPGYRLPMPVHVRRIKETGSEWWVPDLYDRIAKGIDVPLFYRTSATEYGPGA